MTYIPPNPNGSATSANSTPVVIASDQASIPVAATLGAETTKAIGVTRTADGSGNLVTSTGNALDINVKSGTVVIDESTLATSAKQDTTNTEIGIVTETAPTTDTASSGLNGRLQRIAQRLTSIIALLPTSLGQKTMSASLPVVLPSDQSSIPVASTLQSNTGVDIGKLTANQSVNVAQVNGVTPLMGNGVTGTGSPRVTIASDNTAFSVNASGTKTNNNAAPGATNQGVLTGIANAAVPTWTEGNQVLESMDLSGNQRVTMGTALSQAIDSILTYPFGHSYAHISTSTTTTVKSGAGVLHNISVNTLGTVASATTVYDNTAGSGTVIAVINTLTLSGSFVLDVAFATGLTLVTTGTVAPDITVSYR